MMIEHTNIGLLEANGARIDRAQTTLQTFSARGVPTLIADSGKRRWKLDTSEIYANPQALINQLNESELTLSDY